jgi:hypothetical protein
LNHLVKLDDTRMSASPHPESFFKHVVFRVAGILELLLDGPEPSRAVHGLVHFPEGSLPQVGQKPVRRFLGRRREGRSLFGFEPRFLCLQRRSRIRRFQERV